MTAVAAAARGLGVDLEAPHASRAGGLPIAARPAPDPDLDAAAGAHGAPMTGRLGRSGRAGVEAEDRRAAARAPGAPPSGFPAVGGLGRGGPLDGPPGDLGAAACAHGAPVMGRPGRAGSRGGAPGDPGRAPSEECRPSRAERGRSSAAVALSALYEAQRSKRARRRSLSQSRSRSRRRRRARSRSSSRSRSPVFRQSSGTGMNGGRAQRRARRHPGLTLKEGLSCMARFLPRCVGGVRLGDWEPRVVQYLTTVVDRGPKDLGVRNRREMRTLAEALDRMLEGDYLGAGDILMARFAAVEMASTELNWAVPSHLELIPSTTSGAATEEARHAASKEELLRQKLLATFAGTQGGRGRGTGRGLRPGASPEAAE